MARLGRREWIRVQGRANAALLLLAREMQADFVEAPDARDFASVRGRTHGAAFELRAEHVNGSKQPVLLLTIRHFQNQAVIGLDGPGLLAPELDPDAVRIAIEHACHRFATQG